MDDRSAGAELTERLFVPKERWGWEYVDPTPVVSAPGRRPVWVEPTSLELARLQERRRAAKAAAWRRVGVGVLGFVVAVVASAVVDGLAMVGWLALAGGIAWAAVPIVMLSRQIDAAWQEAGQRRAAAYGQFEQADRQWQQAVAAQEDAERRRSAESLLWHPLQLQSNPSRIDVFGGTGDGWASLTATLGCTLLQAGCRLLLVDFSEFGVGSELAAMAASRGFAVSSVELPTDLGRTDLFAELSTEDLAEILSAAVDSLRPDETPDLRALDAELISAVASRLDGPATFTRLAAGLRVLLRRLRGTTGEGPLTAAEETRLASCVDDVGEGERVTEQVRFLTNLLDLAAQGEPPPPAQAGLSLQPASGLLLVTTSGPHQRRKDFVDRVVFHRVVHELRSRRGGDRKDVLIVASADHLGRASLEELARQARLARVRLVLLLEHLRGEVQQVLGGADSAAVIMRLGNAQEAAAAAEFIGRGHRFVLSQLTAQVGETFTEGTGESLGGQEGVSSTTTKSTGRSRGPGGHSGGNQGSSRSTTESRAKTWQETRNRSTAESLTQGATTRRVYEFMVEPARIQSLPATAFVLVEAGHSGRRVVLGDCNPGITLLDRVSAIPRQ